LFYYFFNNYEIKFILIKEIYFDKKIQFLKSFDTKSALKFKL